MSTASTLELLKENDEDWEWYPTTDEIIRVVSRDIIDDHGRSASIMDIGAGDGRVLVAIAERIKANDKYHHTDLFAIEKSFTHLAAMPKNITVIGTDFEQQSLSDKPVDVVFCNPPYSQYEMWMERIVSEASAKAIYMVIPRRWRDVVSIQRAIESRSGTVTSLGKYDFENADRRARALVELIRIEFNYENQDAFNSVLEGMFPELDVFSVDIPEPEIDTDLMRASGNIVDHLVDQYNHALNRMLNNYKAALKIDGDVLREIGVSKDGVLEAIKLKIKGMKDKYWQILFDELGTVTQRLATKQRKAFLSSIRDKITIDFTANNVYSILIWVTKWANDYFDEQLTELFWTLSTDSCINYKSNQRVWAKGDWRYRYRDNERPTHYRLEYRIVLSHGGIATSQWSWDRDRNLGLAESAMDLLMDICTVANNLAFACSDSPRNYTWRSNVQNSLMLDNGEVLVAVRAFKNGNLHLHFNPKVMLAINVEAGRLLKWIRNPEEACEEMGVTGEEAEAVHRTFGSSFRIADTSGVRKLEQSIFSA